MKTTIKILCIFLLFGGYVYSQSLSIGIGSGISIIQGHNYFTDNLGLYGLNKVNGTESSFAGLRFKSENSFMLEIDYGIKNIPISLMTQINYIPMRGNGSVSIYDYLAKENIQENVITKLDIWSFCIGTIYKINLNKIKPYAKALFLANYFGDTRLEFDYGSIELIRPDYKNGMRYGLNFGLGIKYEIFKEIGLDIEGSYSFMNIWNGRTENPANYSYESVEAKMNTLNLSIGLDYIIL